MSDNFGSDDWRAERLRRNERRLCRFGGLYLYTGGRSLQGRLLFAVFLILAGVFLFLDNLGILHSRNIWAYSPLIMVIWGVSIVSDSRTLTRTYWGAWLIVLGVLAVLANLGVLPLHTRDDSWILALVLIALGFAALLKTVDSGAAPKIPVDSPQQFAPASENVLNEHAVAGSIKRRVETTNFLGGRIECVFGSVELDLRNAQIASVRDPVTMDVNCVFGSTEIRIPDTWVLVVRAAGVFGAVEDKTISPRVSTGINSPTLIVTGQSVFGSIEVAN